MSKVAKKEKGSATKEKVSARIRPRCTDCGFRIRGENHEKGVHHKSGGKGNYVKKHRY